MVKNKAAVQIVCNLDRLMLERPEWRNIRKLSRCSGLSRQTVYNLRDHKLSPSIESLNKLANALSITHAELLRTEPV